MVRNHWHSSCNPVWRVSNPLGRESSAVTTSSGQYTLTAHHLFNVKCRMETNRQNHKSVVNVIKLCISLLRTFSRISVFYIIVIKLRILVLRTFSSYFHILFHGLSIFRISILRNMGTRIFYNIDARGQSDSSYSFVAPGNL